MKRLGIILTGFVFVGTGVRAGEPGLKQSIAYVQKLQTSNGGFLSQAPRPNIRIAPTLRATSSAVRALHYFGAEIPNKDACIKYVESCHDPKTGGFGDVPMGEPNVFATAVGLMAVIELKMPTEKYADLALKYLANNAKTFDEIRIAVAGFETLNKIPVPAVQDPWLAETRKLDNKDDTFGKGPGMARETGSRVVTLRRLGAKVRNPDLVLKVLKDGQRQNGGWGKEDSEIASDLETTYRVMRCYRMLKSWPENIEGVRSFVAKCRNEDGGYGVAPGQPSSMSGTYFAAIITHWLKQKPG